MIVEHFKSTFLSQEIVEKCAEMWVYIVYQLGVMIAESPKDFSILSELIGLSFSILDA